MTKAEAIARIEDLQAEKQFLVDEFWENGLNWDSFKNLVADCNEQMRVMADIIKPFAKCAHRGGDCYHYFGVAPMGQTR